jgi:hypothetical protein
MPWIQNSLSFIWEVLKSEFIAVVAGIIFVQVVQRIWDRWRFGKWKVILVKNGEEFLEREISTGKSKEILGEDAELAVFLKGVISPYAWVTCDLLKKGREINLLVEDKKARRFIVNLDYNPKQKPKTLDGLTSKFASDVMALLEGYTPGTPEHQVDAS